MEEVLDLSAELNVVYKKIEDLKPFPGNSKVHTPEQVKMIAEIIKRFGWTQIMVVDINNVVIEGHGRLEAAKLLGLKEVPCRVMEENYTTASLDGLRIIVNRLAETGWDRKLLEQDIQTYNYDFTPFNADFALSKMEYTEMDSAQKDTMSDSLAEEKKRQIVLYYDLEKYNKFMAKVGEEIEKCDAKNVSQLIKKQLLALAA